VIIKQSDLLGQGLTEVFQTHDGLCAWRRDRLPDAIADLDSEKRAVLGGEVWVVEGNLFSPLSPRRDGGWAIFSWEAPPRLLGEPWDHYVGRTLRETLDTVRALDPEGQVPPDTGGKLYYHLRTVDELGYYALQRADAQPKAIRGEEAWSA